MRLGKIERAVLASLLVPGVIVLAVVAGNAVQLLKYADPKKRQRFSYKIPEIVRRLSEKGLVRVRSERGTPVVELTGRGKQTVELIEAGRAKIKNSTRWDGRWRIVIFDVPEKKKGARNRMRYTLVSLGFHRIQDSVWAYPYDCEDLIALLKTDFNIGKDVLYIIAEHVEGDYILRRRFGLSSY